MNLKVLSPEELELIKKKRSVRRMLTQKSHYWFFSIYLSHYLSYPFAPFHHEIFALTEDTTLNKACLVAFRGSGKSTLVSFSYPIWAIVGYQQKKFVLILSQTQYQARVILTNIRKELESNELLKADVGPFEEDSDEWGSTSIVLKKFGARITCGSTEQSIRGLRHNQHRPDLVIVDDPEDLNSVKTREGRDKIFSWLTGEVFPIGDKSTKFIIVGNLLHEDCLVVKLKNLIAEGKLEGKFLSFPLLSEDDQIAWPGKFPDMTAINTLKNSTGNESAWQREYLLRIIASEDQVIRREWIHYYDVLPNDQEKKLDQPVTAIDVAISQKESADYTAMVSARKRGGREALEIYILPNPVNNRLTFPQTVSRAKELSQALGGGHYTYVYVEEVAYQQSLIQQLRAEGVPTEGVKIGTEDKRARLALTSALVEHGKILFPQHGCEELINQLVNFGVEKHDDLADAFSMLIQKILDKAGHEPNIYFLPINIPPYRIDPLEALSRWGI